MLRWSWIISLGVIACVRSNTVTCPGGRVCPPSSVCVHVDTATALDDLCVAPEQIEACTGDGAACIASGRACHDGVCFQIDCGNGLQDTGEVCDDGNNAAGDGCSADCLSIETCGNGIVDAISGEQCDEGVPHLSSDGCTSQCSPELASWRDVATKGLDRHTGHGLTFDSARHQIVLFGGTDGSSYLGDTWEWDGDTASLHWKHRHPVTSPPARAYAVMQYDPTLQAVVLFGGIGDGGLLDDMWKWDGLTWTQLTPATHPTARRDAAASYDTARNRLVVFGGTSSTALSDTWEWNGTTWTQSTSATVPASGTPQMTYDAVHAETVLTSFAAFTRMTYTWNGTDWTQKASGQGSTTMIRGPLLFDGQDALTFDFQAGNAIVWKWNGTAWSSTSFGSLVPNTRSQYSATYVPAIARTVIVGGSTNATVHADTYVFDSAASTTPFTQIFIPSPPDRSQHTTVYDVLHGQTLMFGGVSGSNSPLADAWTFDSDGYFPQPSLPAPSPRLNPPMAYDSGRDRIVLFGGSNLGASTFYADTWEWNGTTATWTDVTPGTGPTPQARAGAAIAYDETAGVTVLFGGRTTASALLADTWTWNGTVWTQRTPATSPPAQADIRMEFDAVRKRIVMLGHTSALAPETWEWDGTTWTNAAPATQPNFRINYGLAYDPNRRRIVIQGGFQSGSVLFDGWEWDGTTWAQLTTMGSAGGRQTLVYDRRDRRYLAIGGLGALGATSSIAALQYTSELDPPERCVSATGDDDGDGDEGCADPDCWGRCTPLCPPGTTCPATAPHCGDGTCGVLEDRVLCPADCS